MKTARIVLVIVSLCALPLFADGAGRGDALLFSPTTTARTPAGAPVTLQTDNMRVEATVKWLGPSSLGSLVVYNGNGCCSGWGILVLASTDNPPNVLAVLAGGIVVATSPLTLTANKWQHVTMDRVNGNVTMTVASVGDGDDIPPQTFSFGFIPVNPVGSLRPAQTLVGDEFNGFLTDARITDLSSNTAIEMWDFTHPPATSGPYNLYGSTVAGVNGHVLTTNASWAVRARGKSDQ